MSRLTSSSNISQLTTLEDVQRFVDLFCQDVQTIVNGGLDFSSNFNAQEITCVFSSANTDTIFSHSLGRVPSRYIVTSCTQALTVYNGSGSSSVSTIVLRSSSSGTATILIY